MNLNKSILLLIALGVGQLIKLGPNVLVDSVQSIAARSATVRMEVRDNRAFIPIRVLGPNGKSRVVLFWVDSGGDTVALGGPLAHDLGLKKTGATFTGMGGTASNHVTKPRLSIVGMKIDLTHVPVSAALTRQSRNAFAGVEAEGFLPATVLRKYDVVFDYPAHRFTLAQQGSVVHRGSPVRMLVHHITGFARVEISVDRKTYGFMLDTGAAYTGISRSVMDRWIGEHATWPHSVGAVGAANMVGKRYDATNELLRVPKLKWGPFLLRNVGMVSRPAGMYEKVVSQDMTDPIVGALSGNVLSRFRLELDYPASMAYLESNGIDTASDLDCVGLILQVKQNGSVIVSGVSARRGRQEVAGVEEGDILQRVDGHRVAGASLAEILALLSGAVGETKHLIVRRGRHELQVVARVSVHP